MARRSRVVALLGLAFAVVGGVGAITVPISDMLSYVLGVGAVLAFFGIRLLGFGWHDESSRFFDFWGGMTETTDQLLERYRRPGTNPILPPGGHDEVRLSDVEPLFRGHPVGRG